MEKENVRSGSSQMTERKDHPLQGLYDFLLREFEAIPTSGEAVTADIRPHFNALCEYMAADETKNSTPTSADVIEGMREARDKALEEAAQVADKFAHDMQGALAIARVNRREFVASHRESDIATAESIARHIRALALPDSKPDKER